jgi:hypothetical protein
MLLFPSHRLALATAGHHCAAPSITIVGLVARRWRILSHFSIDCRVAHQLEGGTQVGGQATTAAAAAAAHGQGHWVLPH